MAAGEWLVWPHRRAVNAIGLTGLEIADHGQTGVGDLHAHRQCWIDRDGRRKQIERSFRIAGGDIHANRAMAWYAGGCLIQNQGLLQRHDLFPRLRQSQRTSATNRAGLQTDRRGATCC